MTKNGIRPILNPVEIENSIIRICDEMEAVTELYSELSQQAAETEAQYKYVHAKAHVEMAAIMSNKMTVTERQSRADLISESEFRVYRINEARRQAAREALLSLRARLDALRTLSANLRHQT